MIVVWVSKQVGFVERKKEREKERERERKRIKKKSGNCLPKNKEIINSNCSRG